jgi:hypothetical protein
VQAEIVFSLLPPAVALALWLRPAAFSFQIGALEQGRVSLARLLLLSVALIPVALFALASGHSAPRYAAFGFSSLAALWGGRRLAGNVGAAAAALLIVLAWTDAGGTRLLAFDLAGLLAGIGGGVLLAVALGRRVLSFLVLLVAVDCCVVGLGLTADVVSPASLGPAPALAFAPPVFAGVAVDGYFLGSIDLACAAITAFAVRSAPRRTTAVALAGLLVAQTLLVLAGSLLARPLPATVPVLAVLVFLRLYEARRRRAEVVPVALSA